MKKPKDMTCICCPIGCDLHVEEAVTGFMVTGNRCPRGKAYALEEMTMPKRMVTSTVKIIGSNYPVISVKTDKPVPKDKIFPIMDILSGIEVKVPIQVGDIIIKNAAGTDANILATKNMLCV
jgi:CxxC motif-containing protein